jgi:predicted GIY-YIG superfamily endonuclease
MWYVYALQSVNANFLYVGHSHDVDKRVREHNEGLNQSTKHYAPFVLATYVAVRTEEKAIELEKYFKTGSGKAILKKRFV